MESQSSGELHWGGSTAPVVLRVRQQGRVRPTRGAARLTHRRVSSWKATGAWSTSLLRSDRLILLASLPLIALVTYVGWQMVASSEPESSLRPKALVLPGEPIPEMTHEPVSRTRRAKAMPVSASMPSESTPRPATPEDEALPVPRSVETPSPATEQDQEMPILPAEEATIHPTKGHTWSTDEDAVESADCWTDEASPRLGRAEAIPATVGRIESVEPAPRASSRPRGPRVRGVSPVALPDPSTER